MEVKEAIEFVKIHNTKKHFYTWEREGFKKVISLLKQGEALRAENVELKAYRNIYEKIKKEYGSIMKVDYIHYSPTYLGEVMEELEQKYFPKEERE